MNRGNEPMAKKYQQRTHVSIRKKKEEEAKLAKRRAFYLKNKQTILIAIGALAVIILLGSLVLDYFYAPGGSMKVFMGNLIGKTEDFFFVFFERNASLVSGFGDKNYIIVVMLYRPVNTVRTTHNINIL